MAKQRFLNNFTSTFIAAVKDAPSSGTPETELDYGVLRISDGAAGSLINPTDGDYYLLTAFKRSGSVESNIEVMRVTGVNNATPGECRITVQRAQEGTSAKAFVAGDYLSLRITKGTAENFSQPADLATKEPVIAAPGSAPTEKYWRGDKTWRDFATDVRDTVLTGLSTATNAVITAADTVLAALGKLQAQITGHKEATSNAHLAKAIQAEAVDPPTSYSMPAGTVQSLLAVNWSDVGGLLNWQGFHTSGAGTQHPASTISNTPAGNISATTVQDAINELDSEKVGKTGNQTMTGVLTAGGLLSNAGVISYGTGAGGTAAQPASDGAGGTGKSSSFTLNKPSGVITTQANSLAAGASVNFDLLDTFAYGCVCVAAVDYSTPNYWNYKVEAVAVGAGRITFRLTNMSAVSLGDNVVINFVLLQIATS